MTRSTEMTCLTVVWLLASGIGLLNAEPSPSMLGFNAAKAITEQSLEQRYDEQLDTKDLRDWMQRM